MTDLQIIDKLMSIIYGDGEHQSRFLFDPLPGYIEGAKPHEVLRVVRKMESEGVFKILIYGKPKEQYIELEDIGMEIMKEYGSYSKYLEAQKIPNEKKDKIERKDRQIKNVGILSTLLISAGVLIATQYNRWQDKRQEKKEQPFQSLEKKIDSLLKVLPPNKIDTPQQSKEDTAKRI